MIFSTKNHRILLALSSFAALAILFLGLGLGMNAGKTRNLVKYEEFGDEVEALPSVVLDINGEIITEFFSDEKREYIDINELPKNMIYAVISREDASFFYHSGFSIIGTFKAVVQAVLTQNLRGASTISQQYAGTLPNVDRTQITLSRKLQELWWSYQLERQFTKKEILQDYLNTVPFGHNNYGVESASEFFFNHSSRENNPAESAMLAIQIANPSGRYSPFKDPDFAKARQTYLLDKMVEEGLLDQERAMLSLERYWGTFDWSKDNYASSFFEREDQAPWFSEYIRGRLNEILYGQQDFYRDGYVVHTTLDLKIQRSADEIIERELARWNEVYAEDLENRVSYADKTYTSMIDMLSLAFNIKGIRVAGSQQRMRAREIFFEDINPTIDVISQVFGLSDLNYVSNAAYSINLDRNKQTIIQTALLTLGNQDHNEGHILAMIGGSQFSRTNQLNRAMDAEISPGSAFKPLYYSAAISSRQFTPATRIEDRPRAFKNADGTYYTPYNYKGHWEGSVLLRRALATSMNVPSIQVLERVGFNAAIERSAALLGIDDPAEIESTFPRVFPLGLGIINIAPVNMARAYATISNYGKTVEPIAIRYIEDRNGNVILNPEKDLRNQQAHGNRQVMSPQEAYIMIDMMHSTVTEGTLRHRTNFGRITPGIQLGGKTGTTQNWADAWTCGFSPYYTTVIWAGFDEKGSSLGIRLTGATATGAAWGAFMKDIHQGLPARTFPRPDKGIVELEICTLSGMIPTDSCEHTRQEIFLSGTEPKSMCEQHAFEDDLLDLKTIQMTGTFGIEGIDTEIPLLQDDSLDDFLDDLGLDIDLGDDEDNQGGAITSSVLD